MAHGVCPPWVGYLMLNPLRKLLEHPDRLFGRFVFEGGRVLEPGCGTGYFTLPLARMVGESGRVVAVDIQRAMLDITRRRAEKAGLSDRIEYRLAGEDGLNALDLAGTIDLAAAMHMVHEVPDAGAFFRETSAALKPGGRLLMVEPRGHTSESEMNRFLELAGEAGLALDSRLGGVVGRGAVLVK
jgi:ubiquinone/menaquinone biosynthesis C-methylase UbiE